MFRICLALAALTLTVAACDSDPTAPAEFDVLPLTVGESWTMEATTSIRFDSEGVPADTMVNEDPRRSTMTVLRDTMIAGERWSRIEFTTGGFTGYLVPISGAWFTNRESSLYRLDDEGVEELIYRIDVTPGEAFVSNEFVDITLDSREAVVHVPAGGVPSAVFSRTEKTVAVPALAGLPVTPRFATKQALSATEGPVLLETLYVTRLDEDALRPVQLLRYELARDGS